MSAAPPLPPNYRNLQEVPQQEPRPPRRALWKRILLWSGLVVLAIVLLVVIAIQFVLHSDTAHRYILGKAQQKATEALGSNVKVGNYNVTFSGISPTLDLYNVVVAGAAPYPDPPLLTIEHARVGVRVVSVFQKKWYLSEAVVNHPVVHVFVDKAGKDNLPQTKTNGEKQSQTNLFDLGIRHAVLDRGEIYYNNRKSVLDADLHNLDFGANFDAANPRYYGTLAYTDGHLKMENFNSIPHSLSAEFEYAPDRFVLKNANLKSGASHLTVNATLKNFDEPDLQAEYSAQLDAGEFRTILKNPTLPVGLIDLKGGLNYTAKPNVPMLQAVRLNGSLASRQLQLRTPSLTTSIRNLSANYAIRNGDLNVRDLNASVLGGSLKGQMTMTDLAGSSRSRLSATLRGVSLAEAKTLIDSSAIRKLGVSGSLNADATAAWGKTFDDLAATANANLDARITPATANAQAVPVSGVIHAKYSGRAQEIALQNSYLRMPETSVQLNGTVSERSALQVNLQANDLHRLENIAAMFQPNPQPLGLYGVASFNGSVTGSTKRPSLQGRLQAANLRVRGSAWKSLRADVAASPSHAQMRNGELVGVPKGRVSFDLATNLANWSFTKTSEFQANIHGDQLDVARLAQAAGNETPVRGTLGVNVQAHGTQLNPMGNGTVELRNGSISGEPIQSASVKFQGTGDVVHANLAVRVPAGDVLGTVDYFPKQEAYDAKLESSPIQLAQLEAVKARNLDLTGVLNLSASGRGTLNNPQLAFTAEIPKLVAQGQTISGITLQGNVENHVAKVNLDSQVINTTLRGRATVNLTGDYETVASIDTQAIPLQPLVALYAPSQASDIQGATELHANLRGPLKNKNALVAHVEIPTFNVNYRNAVQLGIPQPLRADLRNGVLTVQRSAIRGTGTDLQFEGAVPVIASSAPMSMLLQGTVDLRLASVLNPDLVSSGQLIFDINSTGQRTAPNVQGQIRIANASVSTGAAPVGLQNGNGVVNVTSNRLEIARFTAELGGGTIQASGGANYRPQVSFDLAVRANGIRMLYPEGVRSGLGGNVTLTGTPETAYLRGQINVEQLSFTPDFDLMGMMGSFGGSTAAPPAQGFSNNLQLDLAVHTPEGISLTSRELSLQGAMNLNVRGTAAEPVVIGRVNLTNGDLIFRGNRYLLQNATVDFLNPTRTEPVLNASVETTIQQYNIAMHFQGPVERMRTSYTSDPALPPADIINLLAFGKTTEAAAANPNPPGTLGAQSAIASAVAGQVTSRLEKVAGISHLSIDPTLGGTGSGGQSNPGANITIQQRVTSKFFVTFSTDVTSTERQVIQLQYQVSPRFSVSGTRDQNGGFAVDTRFRKRW